MVANFSRINLLKAGAYMQSVSTFPLLGISESKEQPNWKQEAQNLLKESKRVRVDNIRNGLFP